MLRNPLAPINTTRILSAWNVTSEKPAVELLNSEMDARNLIKVEQLRQMAIKESNSYFFIEFCQKRFTHIYSAYHPYLKHPTIQVSNPDNLSQTNLKAHPDTVYFNVESDIIFYDLMIAQPF